MKVSDICPTCTVYYNALCVIYNGQYLPNLNIAPLDSLETALIRIEEFANNNNAATPALQAVTDQGYVTTNPIEVAAFTANGTVTLNSVAPMATSANLYMVLDGAEVKTRTAAELLADIGALNIDELNDIGDVDTTGVAAGYHVQRNPGNTGWIVVPGIANTSELNNDGADGVNPFITALALAGYLPLAGGTMDVGASITLPDGDIILTAGDLSAAAGTITALNLFATVANLTTVNSSDVNTTNLATTGTVTFNSLAALGTAATKFLVLDGASVKSRTAAELLSDIGAASDTHTHTVSEITDFDATQNNIIKNVAYNVNANTEALEKTELVNLINAAGLVIDAKEIGIVTSVNTGVSPITESTFAVVPGKGTYNGGNPLVPSDLLLLGTKAFSAGSIPPDAITIALGDITPDTIEDYLNTVDPLDYNLTLENIYFFTTTESGIDKTYLYVGTQPDTIGNGGTAVTAGDFTLISEDGVDLGDIDLSYNQDVYVHATEGDDATGEIGNIFKPFATVEGVLTNAEFLLAPIGSGSKKYKIYLLTNGTYYVTKNIPNFVDLEFYSRYTCTLSFANRPDDAATTLIANPDPGFDIPLVADNPTYFSSSYGNPKQLTFDLQNGTLDLRSPNRVYISGYGTGNPFAKLTIKVAHVLTTGGAAEGDQIGNVGAAVGGVVFEDWALYDVSITSAVTGELFDNVLFDSTQATIDPGMIRGDSTIFINKIINTTGDVAVFERNFKGAVGYQPNINIKINTVDVLRYFEPFHQVNGTLTVNIELGDVTMSDTYSIIWGENEGTGRYNLKFNDSIIDADSLTIAGAESFTSLTGNLTVVNNSLFQLNNSADFNTLELRNFRLDLQGTATAYLIFSNNQSIINIIDTYIQFAGGTDLAYAANGDYTALDTWMAFYGENSVYNNSVDGNKLISTGSVPGNEIVGQVICRMYGTLKTNGLLESAWGTDFTVINETFNHYPELPETRTLSALNPIATDIMPLFKAPYTPTIVSFYEAMIGGAAPTVGFTAHRGTTLGTSLESNAAVSGLTISAGDWVWLELDTVTGAPYMYTVDITFRK